MARLEKIFGIAFGVLILLIASVDSSYDVCHAGLVLHNLKNSEGLYEERCCVIRKCGPGSRPVICDKNGRSAGCLECDNGQYQDAEVFTNSSKTCYPHTPCTYEKGLKLLTPGTLTSDNVCICDASRGLQPDNKDFINQKSCSCASGFQWDYELLRCKENTGSYKPINNVSLVTNSGLETPTPREAQITSTEGYNIPLWLIPIGVFLILGVIIILFVLINLYYRRRWSQRARRSGSERFQNENSSGTNSDADASSLLENGAAPVEKNDCTTKGVQCTDDGQSETDRLKSMGELDIDPSDLNSTDTDSIDTSNIVILNEDQVSGSIQRNNCPLEHQQNNDRDAIDQTVHVPSENTTIIVARKVKIIQSNPSCA